MTLISKTQVHHQHRARSMNAAVATMSSGVESPQANLKPVESGMRSKVNSLVKIFPMPVREIILATSISAGVSQIIQEFLYAFVPKATNALVVRKSWLMVVYEFLLEFPEYLGLYLLPTMAGALFSRFMARPMGIPHWRLLGEPVWKLKEKLGQEYNIDGIKTKIDTALLNKLSFTKFMTFLMATGAGCAAQVIAPAPRALLAKQLLHTDNFYAISGLQVDESQLVGSSESLDAAKKAKRNLLWSVVGFLTSIPIITLLTLAGRNKISDQPGNVFTKLSKHLDMNERFGISKTLTAFNLAVAPFAYNSVAFNAAERNENTSRLLFLALPEVLFMKQIVESGLAGLVGLFMGAGNILVPPKQALSEMKQGKRDFFYWSLIDKEHILSLPKVKAMDEKQRNRLTKSVHLMEHWVVYALAMGLGFAVNWINYLQTKESSEAKDGHHKDLSPQPA